MDIQDTLRQLKPLIGERAERYYLAWLSEDADGRRELFNLREDQSETTNLAAKRPDMVRRLASLLDAWRKQSGAVMPDRNPKADPAWPGWGSRRATG